LKHRYHDYFGEILTEGVGWGLFPVGQVNDLPAKAFKLGQQGLFNVVALVEFVQIIFFTMPVPSPPVIWPEDGGLNCVAP